MIRRGTQSDLARVLEIVASRPAHFVPAAYSLIEADYRQFPSYVWEEAGAVVGFIVWMSNAVELELLWMAVHPESPNVGIGRKLIHAAMREATTQHIVLLKTATPDSQIPDTAFSGKLYARTIAFFTRLGFRHACRLQSYWGPANHCLLMYRLLEESKGEQQRGRSHKLYYAGQVIRD